MSDRLIGMTVSELNQIITESIRRDPRTRSVAVQGEISGFKHHIPSGHWYFTLKDEQCAVSCVMYRMNNIRSPLKPRDGDTVTVSGYVDVYAKTGAVNLYVTALQPGGTGEMFRKLEELKRRLIAEGLLDPSRKKPLPLIPRKVAVVTSPSGAAIHDILNVSGARCPWIPIVLIPAAVQGENAAAEIARAVRLAGTLPEVDVILVGRGGGSAEDLWCFNAEEVVRAVAGSRIPVVSGVGHETDTTLCDYAADVRAATPSNAAEIIFPDRDELFGRTGMLRAELRRGLAETVRTAELQLYRMRERVIRQNPVKRIQQLTLQSESARASLIRAEAARVEKLEAENRLVRTRLNMNMKRFALQAAADCEKTGNRLQHAMRLRYSTDSSRAVKIRERLEAISPLAVLSRGYAMVFTPEGRAVTSALEAGKLPRFILRFADGQITAAGEEHIRNERSEGREDV